MRRSRPTGPDSSHRPSKRQGQGLQRRISAGSEGKTASKSFAGRRRIRFSNRHLLASSVVLRGLQNTGRGSAWGRTAMKSIARLLGNVRMTTTILVLVLASIIGSIAVVSASIYVNLHGQAMADSRVQQETNLGVAATILERRISGSVLTWSEDGTIAAFQSWAIPPFYDSEVIDSVTRVTKQDAAIYVLTPDASQLAAKT